MAQHLCMFYHSSSTEALVEYTLFSPSTLKQETYIRELKKYIKEIEKWQNTKIDDTYIKIANEYKGCEFFSNWLKQ